MRDVPSCRDETGVHALVGEGVEEVLYQGLVTDLDRPKEDLLALAGAGRPVNHQVLGILAPFSGDEGLVLVDQVQPLRLLDQPGPKVGVDDRDQVHRPLTDVLAPKVGDPVLCDDVLDVASRQGNPRAWEKGGNYPRDIAPESGRWEGEDRLSAGGIERFSHEIGLPSDPAVESAAERLCGGLARQVDLHGAVYGGHPLDLGYLSGGGCWCIALFAVVDDPRPHQLDDPVG